jgi:hypothetical protein
MVSLPYIHETTGPYRRAADIWFGGAPFVWGCSGEIVVLLCWGVRFQERDREDDVQLTVHISGKTTGSANAGTAGGQLGRQEAGNRKTPENNIDFSLDFLAGSRGGKHPELGVGLFGEGDNRRIVGGRPTITAGPTPWTQLGRLGRHVV